MLLSMFYCFYDAEASSRITSPPRVERGRRNEAVFVVPKDILQYSAYVNTWRYNTSARSSATFSGSEFLGT
jgi:hypothetical protein